MDRKRKTHLFKLEESSRGFTLVEVLISIAILAVISVALLLLFNQSFVGIIKSGNKAESIYEGQEDLENIITGDVNFDTNEELTLEFKDVNNSNDSVTITVQGKTIEDTVENADLTFFKTKDSEKVNNKVEE